MGQRSISRRWRLNTSLVGMKEIQSMIEIELNQYIEIHFTEDISPMILWEGANAVLRRRIIIIALASTVKAKTAKGSALERKLSSLETQHKPNPTAGILEQARECRNKLRDMLTAKVERNIRFLRQKYYEQGNKASRLLVSRLRKQTGKSAVQKIRNNETDKPFLYKPSEISEAFTRFYKIFTF